MSTVGIRSIRSSSMKSHRNSYRLSDSLLSDQTMGDQLAAEPFGLQRFLIDGSWGARDFSRFNGVMDDIYSLFSALKDFLVGEDNIDKRLIALAFTNYPLRGGSSYGLFYDDLERAQP